MKRRIKPLRIALIAVLIPTVIYAAIHVFAYSLLYVAENHHRILANYEVMKWVKKLEEKLPMMY